MAGGAARRAGARFSRILKMTAWGMDFCHGLGLLLQVIYIYLYLFKEIRVDLSPRVSF